MSLMGPNARTYRRARSNREDRVYITPAVAALIWKQPQMTGRFDPQPRMPRIAVSDYSAAYDRPEAPRLAEARRLFGFGCHSREDRLGTIERFAGRRAFGFVDPAPAIVPQQANRLAAPERRCP